MHRFVVAFSIEAEGGKPLPYGEDALSLNCGHIFGKERSLRFACDDEEKRDRLAHEPFPISGRGLRVVCCRFQPHSLYSGAGATETGLWASLIRDDEIFFNRVPSTLKSYRTIVNYEISHSNPGV